MKWADLAEEIIVVDSRSTDGTLELIRERLRHPKLRIIERERGLYESWNEGIAATTGDWIYISTAGDTIEREHLLHLLEVGERGRADVVISAPGFVDETGIPRKDPGWPPRKVIDDSGRNEPFILTAEAGFALTFMHFPCAILGSSASNLYRGDHLRSRPFPVDFKGSGDSAWILKHAAQSRLCFTPKVGSTFCVHPKEEPLAGAGLAELERRCVDEKEKSLGQPGLNSELVQVLSDHHRMLGEVQVVQRRRRGIWYARPRTVANLCSWAGATLAYLRKRNQLKGIHRRIRREFLHDSCYQPLTAMNSPRP
jgi:hypothetical protein